MKPVENEVTFQITRKQYERYYSECERSPIKNYEAFGVKWFLVSLEGRQDELCVFPHNNYFVTFRAVL